MTLKGLSCTLRIVAEMVQTYLAATLWRAELITLLVNLAFESLPSGLLYLCLFSEPSIDPEVGR